MLIVTIQKDIIKSDPIKKEIQPFIGHQKGNLPHRLHYVKTKV